MTSRRLMAYLLDAFGAFVVASGLVGVGLSLLSHAFAWRQAQGVMALSFAIWLVIYVLVLAIPTALWGTTPGKWLFRLEVVGPRNQRLTLRAAVAREFLKLLSLLMPFGPFVAVAIMVVNDGIALHDLPVGSQVVPRVKLTETQKRFRQAKQDPKYR